MAAMMAVAFSHPRWVSLQPDKNNEPGHSSPAFFFRPLWNDE